MAPPTKPPAAPSAPPPPTGGLTAPKIDVPGLQMRPVQADPPRMVLVGVEGVGKTSLIANYPGASIIQCARETGYDTLVGQGRVPHIPSAHCETWEELTATVTKVAENPPKLLGLDTVGGAERMCHEHVCRRDFGGDWSDKGFASFAKGYDVSIGEWLKFLALLDRVHNSGCAVVLLGHMKIKPFRNPEGPDYDRYVCDIHEKTWSATNRWADTSLFMKFETVISENKGKVLGKGTDQRMCYTTRTDARDAKNRYGMPPEIEIPNDPTQAYTAIWQYIKQ